MAKLVGAKGGKAKIKKKHYMFISVNVILHFSHFMLMSTSGG